LSPRALSPEPDLRGRYVLITGGNSGIGQAAAVGIARLGAHVAITARNAEKGETARATIAAMSNNDDVEVVPLDLGSLASIHACADTVLERTNRIDVLVNNAGGTLSTRRVTDDGFEMTFGVNHLGHFLLTNLLLDRIKESAPARIITVASAAHRGARDGLDFDDLQCERTRYRGFPVYCRSKLANVLFATELARRLEGTGVTSNAMHPGWVGTNFGREGDTGIFGSLAGLARPLAKSPEQGADTIVYLASAPDVANVTGKYFAKRKPARMSAHAANADEARRLWDASERLVGLTQQR
jgi:NAD(P)-dependent dehydrogenase (short-subunit alcohol dehydrogenase family)